MIDSVEVLDCQLDQKIKAYSIIALMSTKDYLELTEESEENLGIQRRIISSKKSKIYDRLIEDLKLGCIIPPIVLVVRKMDEGLKAELKPVADLKKIEEHFSKLSATDISILDGLQRTNCLRKAFSSLQLEAAQLDTFLSRKIRVEFWVDIKFEAILYRMITLNAGQTPMSMKHQLEILNLHLIDSVKNLRPDIEIFTTRDTNRRTKAKQFQFSLLVEGYNAFINRSPFTDPKNQVIEELNRISFLDSFERSNAEVGLDQFVNTIADIDEAICNKYREIPNENNENGALNYGHQFFGKQPYFIGFCAALGRAFHQDQQNLEEKKTLLIQLLMSNTQDPLSLELFNKFVSSIPASAKVGDEQREITTEGFEQFFVLGRNFYDAWTYAGSRIKQK